MEHWKRLLYVLGVVLGIFQILFGFYRFWADKVVPALFISLATVIAGPLEDILKAEVRRRRHLPRQEPAVELVDLATSVAFMICLIIAIYLL
jgi:hypothetical protein